jgi:hypothetical protein
VKQIAVRRDQMARANRARRDGNNIQATPVPGQGFLTFAPALNDINSGVGGKERLVRQAGSELLDVEGPVQTGVKLLAIGEKADLESLASE